MAAAFYGSLADADTYFSDRGATTWTGTDAEKTAALVRGSQFIDARYGKRFPGTKTGGYSQVLAWPRTGAETYNGDAIPSDEVPLPVQYAAYESALLELTSPGTLNPVVTGTDIAKREKIGPIEVEYAIGNSVEDLVAMAMPTVTVIDGLLWPFLYCYGPAVLVV